jgi:hypothetical protein
MGTSISHRSPETARWRAVHAAYTEGLSDERVATELLRAAENWGPALKSDAVAHYIRALEAAHAVLADRLRDADFAHQAIQSIVDDVRQAALSSRGDISAVALAERAFQRTLVGTSRAEQSLVETPGKEAAAAWTRNRGRRSSELIGRFAHELFSQFARHVVARDIAALVGHPRFEHVGEARTYKKRIAEQLGSDAATAYAASERVSGDAWRRAVDQVFAVTSAPPHD